MKQILALMILLSFAVRANPPPLPPPPHAFEDFQKRISPQGLVPSEDMARTIGKAILEANFGTKEIESYGPLDVYSEHDYWVIETHGLSSSAPFGHGGCGVTIARRDARILSLGCAE